MIIILSHEEYTIHKNKYYETIEISGEWEKSLETKYNEDEELNIMDMISYWSNQLKGFGKNNDETHYADIRNQDSNQKLYEEAIIGFAYVKKCFELRTALKKWDAQNR